MRIAIGPAQHRGARQPGPVSLSPGLAATGPAGNAIHPRRSGIQHGLQHLGFDLALDQNHCAASRPLPGWEKQRPGLGPLLINPLLPAIALRLAVGVGQRVFASIAGAVAQHIAVQGTIHHVSGGVHQVFGLARKVPKRGRRGVGRHRGQHIPSLFIHRLRFGRRRGARIGHRRRGSTARCFDQACHVFQLPNPGQLHSSLSLCQPMDGSKQTQ